MSNFFYQSAIMEKINLVDYEIFVGAIWEAFDNWLATSKYSKIVVLVDENTRRDCLPVLLSKSRINEPLLIEITSGEVHKNIETCQLIWQQMLAMQLDRNALLINLGGGVIGDMGGFCASTFKRGIDFIQMPTSLLSQVDASIGSKLGIDFGGVKNSIGLFQHPKAVFIFPPFLDTLPKLEIRSGFAEMMKHGLIADAWIWKKLKALDNLDNVDWQKFIIPSLKIKKQIVAADPLEQNIRKKLNFGHTIGHALESFALLSATPLLHGEAIAAGMICEAWLSAKFAGLSEPELNEMGAYILKIFGKVELGETVFPDLLTLMENDKKNESSAINFTLLMQLGEASINHVCNEKAILKSLKYYNQL